MSFDSWEVALSGRFEFDGRPIHEPRLNEEECRSVIEDIKKSHIELIAVSSIYSPVKNDHEIEFKKLAKEVLGEDFPVTLSSEIGNLGLLERENSAALHAALIPVANMAVQAVLSELKIDMVDKTSSSLRILIWQSRSFKIDVGLSFNSMLRIFHII